jgi:hypothetical protein
MEEHQDCEPDQRFFFEMKVSFDHDPAEDGQDALFSIGTTRTHIHGLPPQLVVDACLHVARDLVQAGMEDNIFSENVPEEVRLLAVRAVATEWLTARLKSPEFMNTGAVTIPEIPDDASSLLED